MKEGIHPDYHPVVFVDTSADFELVTRSTKTSDETREIDGVDHYVLRVEISSASHPFFTGQQRFVDTAGRVEKFQRKYEKFYKKDDADAPAADADTKKSDAN
jgi:large subunit ribosomal protein L31